MTPWLTVVGIGEDGFSGLGKQARRALLGAGRVFGSPRQLALLPRCVTAEQLAWPSPFSLAPVLALRGEPVCVLASGDPMFYGVGASLARQVPAAEMRVLSMPSSCALAAARLGWPLQDLQVVSLVARPLAALNAHLHSGMRLLVLSNDGDSPAAIAAQLRGQGFGPSRLQVFEHLGVWTNVHWPAPPRTGRTPVSRRSTWSPSNAWLRPMRPACTGWPGCQTPHTGTMAS